MFGSDDLGLTASQLHSGRRQRPPGTNLIATNVIFIAELNKFETEDSGFQKPLTYFTRLYVKPYGPEVNKYRLILFTRAARKLKQKNNRSYDWILTLFVQCYNPFLKKSWTVKKAYPNPMNTH